MALGWTKTRDTEDPISWANRANLRRTLRVSVYRKGSSYRFEAPNTLLMYVEKGEHYFLVKNSALFPLKAEALGYTEG